ncbi:GntR family transcriptional regulator [Leucobacter allii]|uniref:GntR family transcriptional regulator n=1 Tax=Leucobacter allii TaxID=2932247 RepID=UPI001FD090BC|nr:GntR family transcriptional regulator [Leucobacter allii]UOR02678.1 GntR family transcriptional regulator [Leucobacter allii]
MSSFPTASDGASAGGAPFTPLTRPLSLRETVLEQIRTAIITGEIAEGELVSAPTLGQSLGVSATPVREAMMELARDGVVETVKNKGFRVTAMTAAELDDLAEIRLMIEPPAMHRVAGRLDDDSTAALTRLADACLRAAEHGDLVEYLRHDREFHAVALRHAGNAQLVQLATSLRVRTRMYGIATLARDGRLAASAREHHELVRLLRAGDADGAERLMRTHIGHARKAWATGRPEAGEFAGDTE